MIARGESVIAFAIADFIITWYSFVSNVRNYIDSRKSSEHFKISLVAPTIITGNVDESHIILYANVYILQFYVFKYVIITVPL